ncbi:tyrosine-protein kinase Fyn-like [Procambarus clarkii]|uniref:tyrosine-protein kinase Fyn-like n=1 Tax=Procambarus clarkii TaxID=6728 RepID=UPI003742DC18
MELWCVVVLLGSGAYGTVNLVRWRGKLAALKVANSYSVGKELRQEGEVLTQLKGAGGAPLLYGVATDPPALLMSYKGKKALYDVFTSNEHNLLQLGLQVGHKLQEVHNLGYVHNDLKSNNIMVEGPPRSPTVSIIDFGLTCPDGTSLGFIIDPDTFPYYAPEVCEGKNSTFASDVFSYGRLLQTLVRVTHTHNPSLHLLLQQATHPHQTRRPTLHNLLQHLRGHVDTESPSKKRKRDLSHDTPTKTGHSKRCKRVVLRHNTSSNMGQTKGRKRAPNHDTPANMGQTKRRKRAPNHDTPANTGYTKGRKRGTNHDTPANMGQTKRRKRGHNHNTPDNTGYTKGRKRGTNHNTPDNTGYTKGQKRGTNHDTPANTGYTKGRKRGHNPDTPANTGGGVAKGRKGAPDRSVRAPLPRLAPPFPPHYCPLRHRFLPFVLLLYLPVAL